MNITERLRKRSKFDADERKQVDEANFLIKDDQVSGIGKGIVTAAKNLTSIKERPSHLSIAASASWQSCLLQIGVHV